MLCHCLFVKGTLIYFQTVRLYLMITHTNISIWSISVWIVPQTYCYQCMYNKCPVSQLLTISIWYTCDLSLSLSLWLMSRTFIHYSTSSITICSLSLSNCSHGHYYFYNFYLVCLVNGIFYASYFRSFQHYSRPHVSSPLSSDNIFVTTFIILSLLLLRTNLS